MPILYDEVIVNPTGILTVQEFKAPRSGRTVKFVLPNGYAQKEIFTCIDGSFSGPFTTAVSLDTAIKGWELLRAGCHNANVIAINIGESELNPISLKFNPIPVTLSSGEQVAIHLSGTLCATVRVHSSEALLLDYTKNGITSAERRIQGILLECFKSEVVRQIPENIGSFHTMNGLGVLDALSEDIKINACQRAEKFLEYPWFKIISCSLDLMSSNMDQIIEKENYLWRLKQERLAKTFDTDEKLREEREHLKLKLIDKTADALLSVYGREPIPAEMSQLLVAYVQNNPMIQPNELIEVCDKFKALSQIYSPDTLLKNASLLGYLPDKPKP